MHIGIDARELTGHPTGVGRYLRGLLREWAIAPSGHRFTLFAHRPLTLGLDGPFEIQVLPGKGGTLWEQVTLARAITKGQVDAFFAPGYTAPLLSGVPMTVAIHDVSFCAHPEWFSAREGARRRFLATRAAHRSRAVITISEFSREEILKHLGVPPERVHVLPPGIDRPPVPAGFTPPTEPRVLFVGSVFNRRHVPELIEAVSLTARRHPDVQLDIVGDNRSRPFIDIGVLIAGQPDPTRIRWHKYVDEQTLGRLYASARAFAFLSEYEGFGLTPLEALSVEVPPVLLDTAVARWSCADAAIYVPAPDVAQISAALDRALFDEAERRRILAAAPGIVGRNSWSDAARLTLATITRA